MIRFLFILIFSIHANIAADEDSIITWLKDVEHSKYIIFSVNGDSITMDFELAKGSFSLVQELITEKDLDNKGILPLKLTHYENIMRQVFPTLSQQEIEDKTSEDLNTLILWLEAYNANKKELPFITLGMVLIADNLGIQGTCVQTFYEQAAKNLNHADIFIVLIKTLNAALNYIKYNPLAFYNHLATAKRKFNDKDYDTYLSTIQNFADKEDIEKRTPLPFSGIVKLFKSCMSRNPENSIPLMHPIIVSEAEARLWTADQPLVNALFKAFPDIPLVVNFADASVIEDNFGYDPRISISTFPTAVRHLIITGNNLRALGNNFLYECKYLVSIVLPDSIVTIKDRFLLSCISLKSINIPKHLTSVGDAFLSETTLESIILPSSLKITGNHFLSGNLNLTSLVLPDNLIIVGNFFLFNCLGLKSLILPHALRRIGYSFLYPVDHLTAIYAFRDMPVWNYLQRKIGNKLVERSLPSTN